MVPTDPIADFLTRIRNAAKARLPHVEVPASRMKQKIAEILRREGYLADVRTLPHKGVSRLRVSLRYRLDGQPMFREIRRLSTPGCRRFATVEEISEGSELSTLILTTSKGVMSDREAREAGVGGELICRVM